MATELDEVQALLEQVLPDPAGYAQRLLLQAMTRWGQAARPGAGDLHPAASPDDASQSDMIFPVVPDDRGPAEPPIDTNLLLAAALGACECWGLRAGCDHCQGLGAAGWTEPDPELFDAFVQPAIPRLRGTPAGGHQQHGSVNAGDGDNHRTAQGDNA